MFCIGFNRPLLNVYPLDLYASKGQQATLLLVVMLPATLKIIFGFLSDNYPIFGYRRKSYMLIGWLFVTFIMLVLLNTCNLTMKYQERAAGDEDDDDDDYFNNSSSSSTNNGQISVPPEDAPSIEYLSIIFLLFGVGLWFADVMADSIVVSAAV